MVRIRAVPADRPTEEMCHCGHDSPPSHADILEALVGTPSLEAHRRHASILLRDLHACSKTPNEHVCEAGVHLEVAMVALDKERQVPDHKSLLVVEAKG